MPSGDFVAVALRGRLGNQLFGFATGYACARRTASRLLFHDWRRVGAEDCELAELHAYAEIVFLRRAKT